MIHADANATYPVRPEHYDRVAALLKEVDGNPSSIHAAGRNAKVALEEARSAVAALLGARPQEVIFTSGATEANNQAIQGVTLRGFVGAQPPQKENTPSTIPHVIVTAGEHKAVLETCELLAGRGQCELEITGLLPNGVVDTVALLAKLRPDTALVCVMHANNETGAITDLGALAKAIKQKSPSAHVHTDAVQMLGKADLTWYAKSAIDSAAFSAHKLGAFKGIGALYLKSGVKLAAVLAGGGQERGRRPGTENLPGIVSFGLRAAEVRGQEAQAAAKMRRLADDFRRALSDVQGAVVHGDAELGLPNTVNFHIDGVPGDDLLLNLDLGGVLASSGSACSSGVARPSHVLMAMGLGEWVALNSVRVSFTAEGQPADVAAIIAVLKDVVRRVR